MAKNRLYILCGLPFSGKSVIAGELVKRLGFVRVDLDEVKFELFGDKITDDEVDQEGWNKVYQVMYERIENELRNGKTVVNDTGNFTKNERDKVRQIADKLSIPAVTIYVNTPKEVARERLLANRQTKQRFDVTDADFNGTVLEMEPPKEGEESITYRYEANINQWISENINE